MGTYLNPDNSKFQESINSDIYVDKTGLITYTNSVIHTQQKCICVSRPRRFGKSMAANMLSAYYSRGCDSKELFQNLEIAEDDQFETYLNQYDVIFLNVQEFLSQSKNIDEMIYPLPPLRPDGEQTGKTGHARFIIRRKRVKQSANIYQRKENLLRKELPGS